MYVLTADPALRVGGHPVIVDADAEFRAAYGATAGCGYLVRPDGHLGFPCRTADDDGAARPP